ncbi:related to ADD66-protein involved in 20S proteasome assembly [Sporisorium scitamineum]|uniref:Proteasome assembly chaperone 2 n=1 Tax=Sporisorium scitamineum TaxID=49012 RepID=A0A127ZA37_9BASI|nr:related to ADD66-protein involved in 20S proteasome assembly [Sporisorium scitamineum]
MTQTPFYKPISGTKSPSFEGTTLIVPAVSIGSVAQLAVDLLLHHRELELVKVGRLDPAFCFPFVGPSDSVDGEGDVTTALEVFTNGSLTLIQQRSPVHKSLDHTYISSLTRWIHSTRFKQVLWLTSIDAAARTDDEFSTPILTLFPSSSSTPATATLSTLAKSFPRFNPQQIPTKTSSVPHIPGSLLTRKLFHHVSQNSSLKDNLAALLYFAAEGDTRPDAHNLANLLLALLSSTMSEETILQEWPQQSLSEPPSWNALFGRPPTSALYA